MSAEDYEHFGCVGSENAYDGEAVSYCLSLSNPDEGIPVPNCGDEVDASGEHAEINILDVDDPRLGI